MGECGGGRTERECSVMWHSRVWQCSLVEKGPKSSTWQTVFVWSVDGWQRQQASDLPARALATGLTHHRMGDRRTTSNARRPELTVGRISPFLTVGLLGRLHVSHCSRGRDGSVSSPSQGRFHHLQSVTQIPACRPVMGMQSLRSRKTSAALVL